MTQELDFDKVETFVGIDAHFEHCAIKAVDRKGNAALKTDTPTRPRALRAALRRLKRPVWVLMESSNMSLFVKQCIATAADRVIVCETRENRWIARSDQKGDAVDADRLARLLRLGEFKEVHVPARARQEIRELVLAYQKAVSDIVRAKCRIRSCYRRHGIPAVGTSLYSPAGRGQWFDAVTRPNVRAILEAQYGILDAAESAADALSRRLGSQLSHTREYRLLTDIPGVGKVVGAIFVAVIDAPERFATKKKLWNYAGLGVRKQWSSDPANAREGGARNGNRLLKYAAMTAAVGAIATDNRFSRHYKEMVDAGIEAPMARKTIARNILAAARAIWINRTEYRDDIQPAPPATACAAPNRAGRPKHRRTGKS